MINICTKLVDIYDTNYLAHYGIKNMKWGVRRYQNKDGTLTPEGKARQAKLIKKMNKVDTSTIRGAEKFDKYERQLNALNPKTKKRLYRNANDVYAHRADLSNDEINAWAKRLQTEDNIKRMAGNEHRTTKNIAEKVAAGIVIAGGAATAAAKIRTFSTPILSSGRDRVSKIVNSHNAKKNRNKDINLLNNL